MLNTVKELLRFNSQAARRPDDCIAIEKIRQHNQEVTGVEYRGVSREKNCGQRMLNYWAYAEYYAGAVRPENIQKVGKGMYMYCPVCGYAKLHITDEFL